MEKKYVLVEEVVRPELPNGVYGFGDSRVVKEFSSLSEARKYWKDYNKNYRAFSLEKAVQMFCKDCRFECDMRLTQVDLWEMTYDEEYEEWEYETTSMETMYTAY